MQLPPFLESSHINMALLQLPLFVDLLHLLKEEFTQFPLFSDVPPVASIVAGSSTEVASGVSTSLGRDSMNLSILFSLSFILVRYLVGG